MPILFSSSFVTISITMPRFNLVCSNSLFKIGLFDLARYFLTKFGSLYLIFFKILTLVSHFNGTLMNRNVKLFFSMI